MKILMYLNPFKAEQVRDGGYADLFRRTDYRTIVDDILRHYGSCTNLGNKVWFQAIVSELSTPENEIAIYDFRETWDEINEKYDAVVWSTANLICPQNLDAIVSISDQLQKSRLPVYVVSVGAQAASYDAIDDLCKSVKKETENFIHTVYNTGGGGILPRIFYKRSA